MDTKNYKEYTSVLTERYSSKRMLEIFSPFTRYKTWRKIWLWLAKAQKVAGLNITNDQIKSMESCLDDIDFDKISLYEMEIKHDVMAHIRAFGDSAPLARPIIHLGATSADITDNADLIIFKNALKLLCIRTSDVIKVMSKSAKTYSSTPCLGFTHLQPAQMTTVGKRIVMWIQSLTEDLSVIENLIESLPFRGIKGATGTADSFHELFNGCYESYKTVENLCAQWAGFSKIQPITGQTYDRKWDTRIMQAMVGLAESTHKITTDLRILQGKGELEEPFLGSQIGSSAMPYKKNPVRSERACSLAKYVMSLSSNSFFVSSTQWLERSLDDSAIRRIYLPESFLACDGFLIIMSYIFKQISIIPEAINNHINDHFPFLISERILMRAVKYGADRQEVHEIIRRTSMIIHKSNKDKKSEFKKLLLQENIPGLDQEYFDHLENWSELIGFSHIQTLDFLNEKVIPILEAYQEYHNDNLPDLI